MRPVKIRGADPQPIGAPADWDAEKQGHCAGLFVRREVVDGLPLMTSAHEVEHSEAALLYAGAKLALGIFGRVHPVIHLGVIELPDDFEPVIHARRFTAPGGQDCVRVEMLIPAAGGRTLYSEQIIESTLAATVATGIELCEGLGRSKGWLPELETPNGNDDD